MLNSHEALLRAGHEAVRKLDNSPGGSEHGFTIFTRKKLKNKQHGRASGQGRGTTSGRGRGGGPGRGRSTSGTQQRKRQRPKAARADVKSQERAPKAIEANGSKKPEADKKAAAKPKRSAWFPQGKKWADIDEEDEQKAPTPLDEDSNPVHPAVRRAVQCTIQRKAVSMWGYIIRVKSRVATVVHGLDSLLTVRLPNTGKNALLGVGSTVGVYQRRKQHMDGSVTTTHHLANFPDGTVPALTLADLPRFRAVVLRVGAGEEEGQVVVPTTGARCAFSAPQLGKLTPGSSFYFIPTFVDGLMRIGKIPDDCGLVIADVSMTRLPVTSVDLLTGFCCPEERLQALIKRKYGVDLMPFVGGPLSCFKYSPGNEVLEEFRRYRKLKQLTNANLKDLEEVLIKASLYKQDREWTDEEVRDQLQAPHKNLYVPASSNAEAFARWIKRDLNKAEKSGPTHRLQAVVGVFVDGDCTLGSLYNTESVPYFNTDKFPWARSFTLVSTPLSCYAMGDQGALTPSVSTTKGKKILLVELDSQNNNTGTLPKPTLLSLRTSGPEQNIQLDNKSARKEFVLVSMPEDDPRCQALIANREASVYRRRGKSLLLALPFDSLREAEEFALGKAEKPMGMFCMLKRDLYDHKTLTLTCSGKKPVLPEELYYLTHAMGVLPIGGHRYRISTNMSMLEAAQVLNFQNRYVQNDKMKYIWLRDDSNGYVKLNTDKSPTQVKLYYRLEPPKALDQNIESGQWYCVSNLPYGATSQTLLEALAALPWWPSSVKEIIVDDVKHQPDAWFHVPAGVEANIPLTIRVSNRPVTIVRAGVPRSVLLAKEKKSARKGPIRVPEVETSVAWQVPRLTKAYVARRAKRDRRVRKQDSGRAEASQVDQKEVAPNVEAPKLAQRPGGAAIRDRRGPHAEEVAEGDSQEAMGAGGASGEKADEKDKVSVPAASGAVQERGSADEASRQGSAEGDAQEAMDHDADELTEGNHGDSAESAIRVESDVEYDERDTDAPPAGQRVSGSDSEMDTKTRVQKRGRQTAEHSGRSTAGPMAREAREEGDASPSGGRNKRAKPVQNYSVLAQFTQGLSDPLMGQRRK